MSLEEVLAEFQQLRRGRGQGERALLGQNVLVPSLGDAAALGVDCPAGPSSLELLPSPPLCGVELGAELELAGLCPSSPDWQLRGLAVQVEAARLSQDDQLQRRSAKLEKIKDELAKCGRSRLKLRREVSSLVLAVSRLQSTLAKKAAEGGQLKEAVAHLTAEVADLRSRLANQTQQQLTSRRLYSRYIKKMEGHECRFVSVQWNSPAMAEVAGLRETLAELAQKRAGLLKEGEVSVVSGQQSDELRTALEDVRERAVAAVARQEEAKEQAASLQQKTDKTLQACNLLKKRNQAQLLRVKRQLQECHAHKRRWVEEASRLQSTISQLKGDSRHRTRN